MRTDCNAGSLSRSWVVETVALEAIPLLRRVMLAFGGMVVTGGGRQDSRYTTCEQKAAC